MTNQSKKEITQTADTHALAAAHDIALTELRPKADATEGTYPVAALRAIAAAGLNGMAIPQAYDGLDLSFTAQARIFAELASGDLAATFVLSQHQGCTTLVAATPHAHLRERWLPGLANGSVHGANGFNFLNLPLDRAPMKARPVEGGYICNGTLPWVTAAHHSDLLAAGAALPDGNQILAAVPLAEAVARNDGHITIAPPMALAGLSGSDTTEVHCNEYFVASEDVLLGPAPAVLKTTFRGATGYVPTAITLGHARSSLALVEAVAAHKGGTASQMAAWLREQIALLTSDLDAALLADDFDRAPILRGRGNALAGRAAQLALIAGAGTGYRTGFTSQRLYREAGFFLVWSVSGPIIPETLTHLLDLP